MNIKYFCLSLFIFSAVFTNAQDMKPLANTAEFLKKLKTVSTTTTSIKADFMDEKNLSYLKQPQKSDGLFYYKKDDKIRWEQKKPFQYIILINDDKIRIKENEKEKDVTAAKQMVNKIKELLLMLVNGSYLDSKDFKSSFFENKNEYIVVLVPTQKKMKKFFDKIQLSFSKDAIHLNELVFFEHSGDKSTMKFFKQTFNEEINDEVFSKF